MRSVNRWSGLRLRPALISSLLVLLLVAPLFQAFIPTAGFAPPLQLMHKQAPALSPT